MTLGWEITVPTYLDVQQRVALECFDRTDLSTEIRNGIQTTIRTYEKQRFWFNETMSALTCSVSVETLAVPADYLFLSRLEIVQNSAATQLIGQPFDLIREMNTLQSVGLPTYFAEYGPKFYLSNVPDSAYPVNCFYVHKLAALSANTDTNDWLSAAEDVIVYGAAKNVASKIQDWDLVAKFGALEALFCNEQLYKLRDQRFSTKLRATRF